jgi:acetate kinase
MEILVLDPGKRDLRFTLCGHDHKKIVTGKVADYRRSADNVDTMLDLCGRIAGRLSSKDKNAQPDVIAIRVIYGGDRFSGPTLYNKETTKRLAELIPESPIQTPAVLQLAEACEGVFTEVPVVLLFETSYFNDLPARERFYAISPDAIPDRNIRRYGFHGILHEEAARFSSAHWRHEGSGNTPRVFSVCLEPRPESAALMGMRPISVKGGATPMEGLLGETSSGDTDPGIMIQLSEELKWGPEKIDRMLAEQSGILALTGERRTLADIFLSDTPACRKARRIFLHQLLLAAGSSIAALGGLDIIVFSGRYREVGYRIAPWLRSKLSFLRLAQGGRAPVFTVLPQDMESVAAALAETAVRVSRLRPDAVTRAAG